MKTNFATMTDEERTSAFAEMDNDALTAALTEARGEAAPLFALTEPTIEQVNEAEALVASIGLIEAEQATRAAAVEDAAKRFAAARDQFTVTDAESDTDAEADAESDTDDETDEDDESDEDDTEDEADAESDTDAEADAEADSEGGDAVTTASAVDHTTSQRVKTSARSKVGRKTARPAVAPTPQVVITAASDVPGFSSGSSLDGMEQVTKALLNRTKGFSPWNERAAQAAFSASGGMPVLSPHYGVASFSIPREASLVAAKASEDYSTVKAAIKARMGGGTEDALTAAGWCAPSENVYTYIADYVVDGLVTVPEVGAPRGGLNITTGPERASQGAALDDFGWTQTEAQAEAGQVKPCETIVCPDFEDHRLDAIGYCYKIPILTQKAYPELITDALRFANVLYAHRTNRRIISDMVTLSDPVSFSGYGASFTDTLEALALIAVAERRRWNVGENANMEVKVPAFAKEVYRADMSRRNGIAKDSVSDGDLAKHFSDRHLIVEYVADWQEISVEGGALVLPGEFDVMMYPAGTFIKAMEDVINLSAVYDAASLSVNEYTGVFFEQAILVAKAGYGSSLVTIPINTAGEQGALDLTGFGDGTANGSF